MHSIETAIQYKLMAEEIGIDETAKAFRVSAETVKRNIRRCPKGQAPKILCLDIETAPMITYAWQLKTEYINSEMIIHDYYVICWAAKWLNDSKMYSSLITSKEARKRDDKRVCKDIYKLLDEADFVVGHNIKGFDIPKLFTRFLCHDFPPLSPIRTIDTLSTTRKTFSFTSNKLNYIAKLVKNKNKIKTDLDLWKGCSNGDNGCLNEMLRYNKQDTILTEDIYLTLRPWTDHPNLAVYTESGGCPVCNGTDFEDRGKYQSSNTNKWKALRCKGCGAYSRVPVGELSASNRKNLMRALRK